MDTPPTLPTQVGDERTRRGDVARAAAAAFVVGVLVFIGIVGVITLLNGNKTLVDTHKSVTQLQTLNLNAAKFFKEIAPLVANLEQNQYVTCLAVHATGCVKPG